MYQHNYIVVLRRFLPLNEMAICLAEFIGPTGRKSSMRFASNPYRRRLLQGLHQAFELLKTAGCSTVYVDGSFVTAKDDPGDFDGCWDVMGVDPNKLDPIFLDFDNKRAAQKARFLGEFFPAQMPEGASGRTFLQFFQGDKNTGMPKGIVAVDLKGLI